jgi:hypothetical protein
VRERLAIKDRLAVLPATKIEHLRGMGASMKIGDAVEIDVYGKWIAGKVSGLQKDGTVKAVVDSPEHDLYGRELICDSEHIREKSVDKKSATVLNDAPNGHAFHS